MGGKISYVTIGLIRNPDGFLICKDNFPRLPVGLKISCCRLSCLRKATLWCLL